MMVLHSFLVWYHRFNHVNVLYFTDLYKQMPS